MASTEQFDRAAEQAVRRIDRSIRRRYGSLVAIDPAVDVEDLLQEARIAAWRQRARTDGAVPESHLAAAGLAGASGAVRRLYGNRERTDLLLRGVRRLDAVIGGDGSATLGDVLAGPQQLALPGLPEAVLRMAAEANAAAAGDRSVLLARLLLPDLTSEERLLRTGLALSATAERSAYQRARGRVLCLACQRLGVAAVARLADAMDLPAGQRACLSTLAARDAIVPTCGGGRGRRCRCSTLPDLLGATALLYALEAAR